MNARYYAPGIGRFASADTIVPEPTNPQRLNRYAYVLNNPLSHLVPTGHWQQEEVANIDGPVVIAAALVAVMHQFAPEIDRYVVGDWERGIDIEGMWVCRDGLVAAIQDLAQQFVTMIRERQGETRDG